MHRRKLRLEIVPISSSLGGRLFIMVAAVRARYRTCGLLTSELVNLSNDFLNNDK